MRLRFRGVALWVRAVGCGGIVDGSQYITASFLTGFVVGAPGGFWPRFCEVRFRCGRVSVRCEKKFSPLARFTAASFRKKLRNVPHI